MRKVWELKLLAGHAPPGIVQTAQAEGTCQTEAQDGRHSSPVHRGPLQGHSSCSVLVCRAL